tara:strand:- start:331 stop:714 length:384 start_codon:yes stop_codon:yes gene_type:complete
MKKTLILIFFSISLLVSFKSNAIDKSTTFTNEIFAEAQKAGKTVVINSWNKSCGTCAAQIKVLNEAEKKFKDVLFLSFEQTKNKDIAKKLNVDFWTTILVYKGDKLVSKTMGQVDKSAIYSEIEKGI